MLRIVPSGLEPLGFACAGVSWLPPGRDPTDSELAADCECAGVALTTTADRLTRLSVTNHRRRVVTFIGRPHVYEPWPHDAQVEKESARGGSFIQSQPDLYPARRFLSSASCFFRPTC